MSNPVNPYQSPTGACQQDEQIVAIARLNHAQRLRPRGESCLQSDWSRDTLFGW